MDPRVKTTPQDLEKQFSLELKLVQALQQANQLWKKFMPQRKPVKSAQMMKETRWCAPPSW